MGARFKALCKSVLRASSDFSCNFCCILTSGFEQYVSVCSRAKKNRAKFKCGPVCNMTTSPTFHPLLVMQKRRMAAHNTRVHHVRENTFLHLMERIRNQVFKQKWSGSCRRGTVLSCHSQWKVDQLYSSSRLRHLHHTFFHPITYFQKVNEFCLLHGITQLFSQASHNHSSFKGFV